MLTHKPNHYIVKMKPNKTHFPAKILLFGEHIINKGANALATPFYSFGSALSFQKNKNSLDASSEILHLILQQIKNSEKLKPLFKHKKMGEDIAQNLWINMDIPIGYGLGSSGAICASIYAKYALQKTENLFQLKSILGEMECAFHGKSSGLDPLVSYTEKSILIQEKETLPCSIDLKNNQDFHIFLIDTLQGRKTAPLVKLFLKEFEKNKDFAQAIKQKIIPLNNSIVEDFVAQNTQQTYAKIAKLSTLHLEYFKPFILEKHLNIWQKALEERSFYLKICGAGGGGFMLGFCQDKKAVLRSFSEKEIIFIN